MGTLANKVALARAQSCFVVIESAKGALEFPLSTGVEAIDCAGYAAIDQDLSFTDSEEIQNTRGKRNQFVDQTPAGTFSVPFYVRPSGTAGSVPMADALWQSLCGKKTVNAGVSVVYSPAMEKPSVSVWIRQDHTVFFGSGGVAGGNPLSITNKGALKCEVSGEFMKLGKAGTSQLASAAVSAASSITVDDGKKYDVGARIWNKTKADSGTNGYEVTAVNKTTGVLTLGEGIGTDWDADDVIEGYLPTANAPGSPLETRTIQNITLFGQTRTCKDLKLTWDDKPQMATDEITASGFPEDYYEDDRTIGGSCTAGFRRNDLALFDSIYGGEEGAVSLLFGSAAGSKFQVDDPRCQFKMPKRSTSKPIVNIAMEWTALETSGDDERTYTFK
ncbi:phage tail tube protein [Fundidesulfovibrio butyratiphilus]